MIKLKVGNERCEIPNQWSELNVSEYAKIVHILQEYEVADLEKIEDEHLKNKQKLANITANQKVFEYLTGLDEKKIKQCNVREMNTCLELMTKFLNEKVETKSSEDHQDSFEWKNKRYYFPQHEMKETKFGDFIEAEQVMVNAKEIEGGRFGLIAKQMAILCKEKNEETTEALIEKKARLFEKLPMDIVWRFVFFLITQTKLFAKNSATSSKTDKELETDMQTKTGKS